MNMTEMSDNELMKRWASLKLTNLVWHFIGIMNVLLIVFEMVQGTVDIIATVLVCVSLYIVHRNSATMDRIITEAAKRSIKEGK